MLVRQTPPSTLGLGKGSGRFNSHSSTVIPRPPPHTTETFPQGSGTTNLPPVRTVTWFHTGAWEAEARLFATFATEYFSGDAEAFSPAETTFDVNIALARGGTMLREAHRALKGKPLRQEVYAEDGLTPTSGFPYSVTMSAWGVRTVQMRTGTRPAYSSSTRPRP